MHLFALCYPLTDQRRTGTKPWPPLHSWLQLTLATSREKVVAAPPAGLTDGARVEIGL